MGTGPDEKGDDDDEEPAHIVSVSPSRALDHEVTNAEYRRFDPAQQGEDARPAAFVSWYSAYVYAAWLGGRLPTEAEWEHMARAGCRFEHCRQDGTEAAVTEVAWTIANSRERGVGNPRAQPIRHLRANPWGLYDVYGNLWEWTADWFGPYSADPQADPWGPSRGGGRVRRGGSFRLGASLARPASRGRDDPAVGGGNRGFRPVLPATPISRR
jgi:formylglycine-generating enzyme required for sulfatase activity